MSNHDIEINKLALAISSCKEVCAAFKDKNHSCSRVVNWQVNEWRQTMDQIEGSVMHRP